MIKALASWPPIERTGVGCVFIGSHTVFADRKGVVATISEYLCDRTIFGRYSPIPTREAGRKGRM
ncbi:hypothetical protein FBZ93_12529 [Bradyrhizobium macuxiense]|uniref:Uncharacterized protein n=1 Tax=Bradyrhizobium macuxiense TaxID=1755647 RepID=A0A560KUF3_9BRAD|nr:hypothetical protein FBZ93_12529 [Bradyrhizobium macuxiense]